MYHSLSATACGSEFSAAKSRFDQSSPRASLTMPNTVKMYHSLSATARGSEFSAAKSRFDQSSPRASLTMPNTAILRRACMPANGSCTLLPYREALRQVVQDNGIEWWLRALAVLGPSVPQPSSV